MICAIRLPIANRFALYPCKLCWVKIKWPKSHNFVFHPNSNHGWRISCYFATMVMNTQNSVECWLTSDLIPHKIWSVVNSIIKDRTSLLTVDEHTVREAVHLTSSTTSTLICAIRLYFLNRLAIYRCKLSWVKIRWHNTHNFVIHP